MAAQSSFRTLLVLTILGAVTAAVHCSSSNGAAPSNTADAGPSCDPTTIRRLTTDQQTLVTQATDHVKAALSPAEWRYLFKLRYADIPRATAETDPVVAKALGAAAQDTPSCPVAAATSAASVDPCDRFVNIARCWADSPVNSATVPCFMWSIMIASSRACGLATPVAAAPVDAQAWDDSQDGKETADCEAPCIAGGGCSKGTCKCAADEAPCAGGCGRTKSDVINCGVCGNPCAAGVSCVEGVCGGTPDAGADAGDGG